MPSNEKQIWFPAKKYGWGWGPPCAWQGWIVLVTFLAVIGGGALFLLPAHKGLWFASVLIACVSLTAVCFIKGEKPRWRWGND